MANAVRDLAAATSRNDVPPVNTESKMINWISMFMMVNSMMI
ncbi:hypothetical protein ACIREO_08945 [Streptomyces sp. NPDC102441]